MKIAVIGANGLAGKVICKELGAIGITRDNYSVYIGEKFDVLVNANGNSSKWRANDDPKYDFIASVESVYGTMVDFEFERYIYISSLDVQKDNIYGLHKRLAEMIVKYYTNYIVLRCSIIIGKGMKKGFLYDALNDVPLYVNKDSEYQIITNVELARIIRALIEQEAFHRSFYVGSTDTLKISDLSTMLNKKVSYRGDAQYEYYSREVSPLGRIYPLKTAEEYIREVVCVSG